MRKYLFSAICIFVTMGLTCCSHGTGRQKYVNELERQRDSISSVAELRNGQIENLTNFFDSISLYIDSIAIQEQILLVTVDPESRHRLNKIEIRQRLELFATLIARQRDKIRMLTDSLNASSVESENYASLSNMILFLSSQLEEKEQKVNQLMVELNSKNKNLRELKDNLTAAQTQLSDLTSKNEILSSAIVEQTTFMNEGSVLIGDKKKLQELGVLSKGGLFKKSNFNPDAINQSLCQRVDIRQVTELPLKSKKPKILSAVPSGSYHWRDGDNGMKILVIDNPASFWSLSNILVIQK